MVGFLKTMAKMSFACREELAIKGVNQYRHTVSMHSYHKSICIGNGMNVAYSHEDIVRHGVFHGGCDALISHRFC
jgi:hypothetical protein